MKAARTVIAIIGLTCGAAAIASANPNGAPWGSADPAAAQNCSSCHFDGEAVHDSDSISVFFQKGRLEPNDRETFYVQFKNPLNKKAGFQIMASAGKFTSQHDDIEANSAQARSIAPRDNSSWPQIIGIAYVSDVTIWKLDWTPPERPDGDIYFWIAMNESDDDGSPLGDQVHYKTIEKIMPGDFWLPPPLR